MKTVRGWICVGSAFSVFYLLVVHPFWGKMVGEGLRYADRNQQAIKLAKIAQVDRWIEEGTATVSEKTNGMVLFRISQNYQWYTGKWQGSAADRDDPALAPDPATCADSALAWVTKYYGDDRTVKIIPGRCSIRCSSISRYRDIGELHGEDIRQARNSGFAPTHKRVTVEVKPDDNLLIIRASESNEIYQNLGTPYGTWRTMRELRCLAWRQAPTNTALHKEWFAITVEFGIVGLHEFDGSKEAG